MAKFSLGNTKEAVKHLNRAIEHAPKETNFYGVLAAAYGELGQNEQAKTAFEEFKQRLDSNWFLNEVVSLYPFSTADVLDRFANGLTAAGVCRPAQEDFYLYTRRTD